MRVTSGAVPSKLVKVGGCASFHASQTLRRVSARLAPAVAPEFRLAGAKKTELAHRALRRGIFGAARLEALWTWGGSNGGGAGQADDAVQISALRTVATRSTWGHAIGHTSQPLPARWPRMLRSLMMQSIWMLLRQRVTRTARATPTYRPLQRAAPCRTSGPRPRRQSHGASLAACSQHARVPGQHAATANAVPWDPSLRTR